MPKNCKKDISFDQQTIQDQDCRYGFQNDFFYISKILRERKLQNGRTQIFVSWQGWPESYNSWVYKDTIMPVDQFLKSTVTETSNYSSVFSSRSLSKRNKTQKIPFVNLKNKKSSGSQISSISIQEQNLKQKEKNKSKDQQQLNLVSSQLQESKGNHVCQTGIKVKEFLSDCQKVQKKTKKDIKTAKILKKRKLYLDQDSQNQLSQTRRKLLSKYLPNNLEYKKKSICQSVNSEKQKADFSDIKYKQKGKKKQHKENQNNCFQKCDSYMINIGDVSDVDLSRISGDSQISFLWNKKNIQLQSLQPRQQINLKRPSDKFCLQKRFKINMNKNQQQSLVNDKKSSNDLKINNNQLNKRNCESQQNSKVSKDTLIGQQNQIEIEKKTFNQQKKQEGSIKSTLPFQIIQQTANKVLVSQKTGQKQGKKSQTNQNHTQLNRKYGIQNQTRISNPDSLLINSIQLTKQVESDGNQTNLLSELEVSTNYGLVPANQVINKNNQTSLLIDRSFHNLARQCDKIQEKNQECESCSFMLLSRSVCGNGHPGQQELFKFKKQEDLEPQTHVQQQKNNKNFKQQIHEKVALLPDEVQCHPKGQKVYPQLKQSQLLTNTNNQVSFEDYCGDQNKNLRKLHRNNSAIDFYFRRQYPELYRSPKQQTQDCQQQKIVNFQEHYQNYNKKKLLTNQKLVQTVREVKTEQVEYQDSKRNAEINPSHSSSTFIQQRNAEVNKSLKKPRNKRKIVLQSQMGRQRDQGQFEMIDNQNTSTILFWEPVNDSQKQPDYKDSSNKSCVCLNQRKLREKKPKRIKL